LRSLKFHNSKKGQNPVAKLAPHAGLARIHFVLAIFLGILTLAMLAAIIVMIGTSPEAAYAAGTALPYVLVVLAWTALHFFAWRKCKKQDKTGRDISMVLGLLMLFGFPIGTVIGVFMIIRVMRWKDEKPVPA
jgi:hypothetical protein